MPFLLLIPTILSLIESVFGVVEGSKKASIVSSLLGLATPTGSGIVGAIESVLGSISDEKKQELIAQMNEMLAQAELEKVDAVSLRFFQWGARPFLFWGLSIILLIHLGVAEAFNIAHAYGFNVGLLAPLDTVLLAVIGTLLGSHIVARTVEKVNNNTYDQ